LDKEEVIDTELVARVILAVNDKFTANGDDGGVLVFLPNRSTFGHVAAELAKATAGIPPPSHPLHVVPMPLTSYLATSTERQALLEPPPDGSRRVILATGEADEASIPHLHISCVVDLGRGAERRHDPLRGVTLTRTQWASQACSERRQRLAGRTPGGHCIRLVTRAAYATFPPRQQPEMLRLPLTEQVLWVAALRQMDVGGRWVGPIEQFLAKAVQPPDVAAVVAAVAQMQTLGALELGGTEELTALGRVMAQMPALSHPRDAKMLVIAAVLGCHKPLLTVIAAAGEQNPISRPRKEPKVSKNIPPTSQSEAEISKKIPPTGESEAEISEDSKNIPPASESGAEITKNIEEKEDKEDEEKEQKETENAGRATFAAGDCALRWFLYHFLPYVSLPYVSLPFDHIDGRAGQHASLDFH
jgi:HrpA-like RNA helicase